MAINRALNPASEAWGRDVERRNDANDQALVRTTMELQNTDRALQDSITRLNGALETVRKQNEYILSLRIFSAQRATADVAVAANTWTVAPELRPSVTLYAPTGRIRIIVSAYGRGAVITYSIPDLVAKEDAVSSYVNQSSQLVLPSGAVSMTTQKEWVQDVPIGVQLKVIVECKGIGADAIIASPSLTVQVIPA